MPYTSTLSTRVGAAVGALVEALRVDAVDSCGCAVGDMGGVVGIAVEGSCVGDTEDGASISECTLMPSNVSEAMTLRSARSATGTM